MMTTMTYTLENTSDKQILKWIERFKEADCMFSESFKKYVKLVANERRIIK